MGKIILFSVIDAKKIKIQNCFSKFEKHVARAPRDNKCQNFNSFLKERSDYFENEFFVKPVVYHSIFLRISAKQSQQRLSQKYCQCPWHLPSSFKEYIRQIKGQI